MDAENNGSTSHRQTIQGCATYLLGRNIGEGAMATVYLAEVLDRDKHPDFPAEVAVKMLKDSTGAQCSNDRKEISLVREIKHANVVRVYDWHYDSVPKFAVFDYHCGGSVAGLFLREGPLLPDAALCLLQDMLSALVATHRYGILHLDIKPGNILIGVDGRFLLSDFGVATGLFVDGGRRIVGSPAYMSPEQARGETGSVDGRSDLFCLGVTLWHLIAGRLPLVRANPQEVVRLRAKEPVPKLVDVVDDCFRPLADVVDLMLAFHPRARPASAAELLAYVESICLPGLATEIPPESGQRLDRNLRLRLRNNLSDPVLLDLLRRWGKHYRLRCYSAGEVICQEGEKSFNVYILLEGEVEVLRGDVLVAMECREGTIMGEVAALIGSARTATLRARGETILALLKSAELEQAARAMPALAVRIMKVLAIRLQQRG